MKLSDIKPNTKNPRRISASALEKLKESIQRDPEFMALRPIVVDKDGIILGGNQRYLAIKELGMKDVPAGWIVQAKNLTPEQRKRFILVDNAPEGMAGEWDWDVLQQDWDVPELEEVGFTIPEFSSEHFQLTKQDIQGEDTRCGRLLLVYKDETEHKYWLDVLKIQNITTVVLTPTSHKEMVTT